jgi:ATP-dependent DNA helicase RecG
MNHTAQELFEILNDQDECPWIEAKGGSDSSHSVMETVCAFANEPGLGGGYILMGVAQDNSVLFPQYKIRGVTDPDKFQRDFATQCAGMFNVPIRPEVAVEKINGKNVIKIWINELPARQKPAYFRTQGLPGGALRRIGSTDQHCTDDDMHVFYQDSTSYDQTPVKGITIADVDENAIKRYRVLREKVNPSAEELTYDDAELLQALGCINREKPNELNVAGLLLFGKSVTQRATFPLLRVDYIRVPGNQWVPDPDDRFTTIDMRGPLLLLLYRLIDAINSDLPKGFLLPDDNIQAESSGLPLKALREAIVNALMHRSYREHRPTQVIRYNNRIDIINPGFSLKSEEKLGQPGSETRNPFIAAVFHDTNLAETKGSGIRAMRRLMQAAHLVPPTFESSREHNEFTARLLLHHFLDEKDLDWLQKFEPLNLTDPQKQALIFVREVGAIDNQTYRQMADCDTLKASTDLRMLKSFDLFASKGKGKATYYISGSGLGIEPTNAVSTESAHLNTEPTDTLSTQPPEISTPPPNFGEKSNITDIETNTESSTQPIDLSTPPVDLSTPPVDLSTPPQSILIEESLKKEIGDLLRREHNSEKIKGIIKEICKDRYLSAKQISGILNKGEDYIKRKYLSEMIKSRDLTYLHAEMINHPEQAYKTT